MANYDDNQNLTPENDEEDEEEPFDNEEDEEDEEDEEEPFDDEEFEDEEDEDELIDEDDDEEFEADEDELLDIGEDEDDEEFAEVEEDEERERRIENEIIVDSYGPEEQALGWHAYLSGKMHFPFMARCISRRTISPLEPDEEVEVLGMAPDLECLHEMFVLIPWNQRRLAVPLIQLEGINVDEQTQQAIEDWRYWVNRGYEFA
jgi:hypothetical protein